VKVLERDYPSAPSLAQEVGEVAVLLLGLRDHQPGDQNVKQLAHGHRQVVVIVGKRLEHRREA
jgi:hypothetical protein